MILIKLFLSSIIFIASCEVAQAFTPKNTQEQKNFAMLLKNGQYQTAMKSFNQVFDDSYKSSTNGYALESLLMFKSGMPLAATRTLLSLNRPHTINNELKKLWANTLTINSPVWKIINLKVSSKWSSVFPYIGSYNGYLFPHYKPKNLKQLKKLEKQKIKSVIMLDWHNYQLGIWNGILDRPQRGLDFLNKIPTNSKSVDFNQIHLAKARLQYQLKNFNAAIVEYQKISKKSDYWAISLEEQAWTFTVQGKDNLSLAKLKSLFSPVLSAFAGPEPYMLTAYNQEQNCDYISSFKTVTRYKKQLLPRAIALKAISNGKKTTAVQHIMRTQANKTLAWEHSSQYIRELPTHFYNDKFLVKYFNGRSMLNNETQKLSSFNISSHIVSRINNYASERVKYLETKITNRLAYLAKKDLKSISNITKKMHLIEAEVIQQLHIAKDIKKASTFKRPKSREVMVFPDDGEIWLDEIDKYSASIGFCNKKKGKAL